MSKESGPSAEIARAALIRLRTGARLSLRELAAELPDGPGAMSHSAIGEVERGVRRLGLDEVFALAATLRVSPLAFLIPGGDDPDMPVALTGLAAPLPAAAALSWLQGLAPADPAEAADSHEAEAFRRRSLPEWWNRHPDKGIR